MKPRSVEKISKMAGVMSLWTTTPMFRIRRDHMLVQTLAMCLAHRAFTRFEFVTDSFGAQLSEIFHWRAHVVRHDLEALRNIPTNHIWALGKLHTCLGQQNPFVQLDTDVLLFKLLPPWFQQGRLVAQSQDKPHYYVHDDMRAAMRIAGLPLGHIAYNAGLLGGSDVELVHAYAKNALEMAPKFHNCVINGTSTSMILEQYHLGCFAVSKGVKVTTLLPNNPAPDLTRKAGYVHLHGGAKRKTKYVTKCEAHLEHLFPAAWTHFQRAWEFVAREFAVDTNEELGPDDPTYD